jgi:ribonucleoside-diphosphate reductase alpha chain
MTKYTREQLESMPLEELHKLPPRNLHLTAVAPNANSSIILGVSASIEPRASNCYTHKTRVGSYLVKNPYLEKVLDSKEYNNKETWDSVMANEGSVQHLECLTDEEKDIFKTAFELDQRWVIEQARARQEFICQGQSVNVIFPAGADKAYVNEVHRRAFNHREDFVPLKGLYYLRTESSSKTEKVNVTVTRNKLQDGVQGNLDTCIACEG